MSTIKITEPVPVARNETVSALSRATIFVRSVPQSLKLYRDILGLNLYIDNIVDGPVINRLMGTVNLSLRAAILQAGSTTCGNLALYEMTGANGTRNKQETRKTVRTGDFAVVFYTNDLDTIAAGISDAQYRIVSPPVVLFEDPEKSIQSREMLFFDADNVLVNLIEQGN